MRLLFCRDGIRAAGAEGCDGQSALAPPTLSSRAQVDLVEFDEIAIIYCAVFSRISLNFPATCRRNGTGFTAKPETVR